MATLAETEESIFETIAQQKEFRFEPMDIKKLWKKAGEHGLRGSEFFQQTPPDRLQNVYIIDREGDLLDVGVCVGVLRNPGNLTVRTYGSNSSESGSAYVDHAYKVEDIGYFGTSEELYSCELSENN